MVRGEYEHDSFGVFPLDQSACQGHGRGGIPAHGFRDDFDSRRLAQELLDGLFQVFPDHQPDLHPLFEFAEIVDGVFQHGLFGDQGEQLFGVLGIAVGPKALAFAARHHDGVYHWALLLEMVEFGRIKTTKSSAKSTKIQPHGG